ncbi:MAG: ABC transporter ATP-binding protein [Beijerinckiaceae bacterium]|nr:ABC transporter ATP-binding protein [Beijerinckiaceae bacterium]
MSEAVPDPILYCSKIVRRFHDAERELHVLRGADLAIWPGQSVALIAPSGSGKSTLLQIAGLLEKPDSGEVYINAQGTVELDDDARTRLRRLAIGFVYQSHHLLPEFTALENVMLPQLIRGLGKSEAGKRGSELLSYLGLGERLTHRPSELSGGEQQRVAIARAVANGPSLLLADEPTGNLDPKTSGHVFETLMTLVRVTGLAAIVATHNLELAARMDRRVTIADGLVVELD